MTTVINNPGNTTGGDDGAAGIIIGIVLVLVLVVLFFLYGLPAIRNSSNTQQTPNNTNIEVNVPTPNVETPKQNQ